MGGAIPGSKCRSCTPIYVPRFGSPPPSPWPAAAVRQPREGLALLHQVTLDLPVHPYACELLLQAGAEFELDEDRAGRRFYFASNEKGGVAKGGENSKSSELLFHFQKIGGDEGLECFTFELLLRPHYAIPHNQRFKFMRESAK